MNISPVRIYINGNGSISFYGPNNTLITNLQNLNGAKQANGQIIFEGDDKTVSFYVYQLTSIESATFSLPYSVLDSRFFNPTVYSSKLNAVYQDVAEYVLVNKNGGASFVGGVVAVYPNYASFPATGQEAVIYIDEGTNQAYFWDGSAYQLLVSTGVEQYANFASFPVTGSANVIYIDMSVPEPYVWDGAAYQSLGGGAVTSIDTAGLISGGPITGSGTITTSMATNKLVGRYSASTGIMQEITIGSGLTLTGAGILNNTATPTPEGYYGAWQDNTTQTAAASNTGYAMIFGTIDLENQVRVVTNGTNLTRITFDNTGIYNLQFSSQFQNTNSSEEDVTIWLRLNGVDVPASSGFVSIPAKHGSTNGHTVTSWNYLLSVVAGQYYELMWSTSSSAHVTMQYYAAGSPPPSAASVILTVTQQSGIMAGTGITAINSLTGAVQTLTTGTTGTDFAISSTGTTHTFNLPTASATNRGALSSADWTTFNGKQAALGFTPVPETRTLTINGTTQDLSANRTFTIATGLTVGTTPITSGTVGRVLFEGTGNVLQESANFFWDNTNNRLGIGTATPSVELQVQGTIHSYSDVYAQRGTNMLGLTNWGVNGSKPTLYAQTDIFISPNIGNAFVFKTTGNFLIGTTTDAGYKLDVNGTARVKGAGATNATFSLTVQNSASTDILKIGDGSYLYCYGDIWIDNDFRRIFSGAGRNAVTRTSTGTSTIFYNAMQLVSGAAAWSFNSDQNYNLTAGSINGMYVRNSFSPTSGTATFTAHEILTTINQTGGANGITRGLYINPTLTAAADFRAIETTVGKVLFNHNNGGNIQADYSLMLKGNNPRLRLEGGTAGTTLADAVIQFADSAGDNWIIKTNRANGNLVFGLGWNNSITNIVTFGTTTIQPALGVTGVSSSTGTALLVQNSSLSSLLTVLNTGNVLIGTSTDAGFKLDVNGTARVSGAFSAQGPNSSFIESNNALFGMRVEYSGGRFYINSGEAAINGRPFYVGQANANSSAIMQADSITKGFLPPRMTTTQKNAIASPASGLVVYDSTTNKLCCYNGSTWNDLF